MWTNARREPVTPPRNGRNHLPAQQLAQGADLRGQVVLFHHQARPDTVEQLVLGEQRAGLFDEHPQQVEGSGAQDCRFAVHQQAALYRLQLEAACKVQAVC